ncbi:MAG: STAS domain-containing protein [Actinomycetota bacterium]
MNPGTVFAVDLNQLDFMDSQGIHMLSRMRDRTKGSNLRFYLICANGPCFKVLKAAGARDGSYQGQEHFIADLSMERPRPPSLPPDNCPRRYSSGGIGTR